MVDFKQALDRKHDCERLEISVHILDCVPDSIILRDPKFKLRDIQVEFLIWVQENWFILDVMGGELPVAAGKSICLVVIGEWCRRNGLGPVAGLTPTTMLQDQYAGDFPEIPMLKGASHYKCVCDVGKKNRNCGQMKDINGRCCGHEKISDETGECDVCPYLAARDAAASAPLAFFNFHSISFNEMWKKVMIIDEGHNSEEHVIGRYGTKLWSCDAELREMKFPENLTNAEEFNGSRRIEESVLKPFLTEYLKQIDAEYQNELTMNPDSHLCKVLKSESLKYSQVLDGIEYDPDNMLLLLKTEIFKDKRNIYSGYYGKEMDYIYIKPLKVERFCEKVLWPKENVDKVIFLSATFNELDIKTLGLADRKYGIFKGKSPIPAENRPFRVWPIASMTWKNRKENIPNVAVACLKLAAKHHDTKGFIHCTYDVAAQLRKMAWDDPNSRRFMFHDQGNKKEVYDRFLASKGSPILVGSGMSEGINLAGPEFGWQVITMVIRPSIADDVNFFQCRYQKEKYDWRTVRTIEQASGRNCRHETDKGITYCLVTEFWDLWRTTHLARIRSGKLTMWADWFIEAVKWPDGKDRNS